MKTFKHLAWAGNLDHEFDFVLIDIDDNEVRPEHALINEDAMLTWPHPDLPGLAKKYKTGWCMLAWQGVDGPDCHMMEEWEAKSLARLANIEIAEWGDE